MSNSNKKKSEQLGMAFGTASNRLRKKILFHLLQRFGLNACVRCFGTIDSEDVLSMEHIEPWLDSEDPVGLFFDLNNIAFSHLACNAGAARNARTGIEAKHGTYSRYHGYKCRCEPCRKAASTYKRGYRERTGIH